MTGVLASLVMVAPPRVARAQTTVMATTRDSAVSCSSYGATSYSPNWIRSETPQLVCIDEGKIRLAGDKQRLDGELTLAGGTVKRFSVENKTMPWLGWANHLRTIEGQAWLNGDEAVFWDGFLASPQGGKWSEGLRDFPAPKGSDKTGEYKNWADKSGLSQSYDPGEAWHTWLTSDEGDKWLEANVEPAWRALTESGWKEFLHDDRWRAFTDDQWRAFVASVGGVDNVNHDGWRAFFEQAFFEQLTTDALWRTLMSDDAWSAMLDRAWQRFVNDTADKTGDDFRGWRAMAATEAGWRAYGDVAEWRAFLADGWRAFTEDPSAWSSVTNHAKWRAFIDDAWRAYSAPEALSRYDDESGWRAYMSTSHDAWRTHNDGNYWRAWVWHSNWRAFKDPADTSWRAWRAWDAQHSSNEWQDMKPIE